MTHLSREVLKLKRKRTCAECGLKNSAYRTVWIKGRSVCFPSCWSNAQWNALKPGEISDARDYGNPQLFEGTWDRI